MSDTLTKSSAVLDTTVFGLEQAKLGVVREFFVDLATGQIGFLIVETAGLLGGSGKYHPIPWSAVRYDPVAGAFHVEVAKDRFKSSPSYDRDQLASQSYGWDVQATRYFGAADPV